MDSPDINCSFDTLTNTSSSQSDEDIPQVIQVLYICFLAACLIIGIPGNVLVATVYGFHDKKSTTDWFIFFVAIFDGLVCLFVVPFYLTFETRTWKVHTGDILCRIYAWTTQSLTLSSSVLLCLIAVDRYKKICTPLMISMTPTRAKHASALCLLVSLILSLPIIALYGNNIRGECAALEKYERSLFLRLYFTSMFAAFVVMFIVVAVSYFMVARRLRHRELAPQRSRRCLLPTDTAVNKSALQESISIGSTSNTSPTPTITIKITDTCVDDYVEPVSPTSSPPTHRTCFGCFDKPVISFHTNYRPPQNATTYYDQFLLQVPQLWLVPDVGQASGPPYSSDMFTASSCQTTIATGEPQHNAGRKSSTSGEHSVTALLFTVTLVFILSWILPWYIFLYLQYSPAKCPSHYLSAAMVHYGPQMYLLNHVCNPVVYSLMSRSFRDNVREFRHKVLRVVFNV